MLTPIRPDTYENLQLNAGIFLKNFTYSTYTSASALKTAIATAITAGTNILGATRGGGTFVVKKETREPEVDGKRYRFKGGTFVDSIDAYLTGTLVEMTPANLSLLMCADAPSTSGQVTTIKGHTQIKPSDYLTNLVWVGDVADGRVVLIALDNALNTSDLTLTFTDKGEGTVPFEFHAHQATVNDYDVPPFEVIYLDDPAPTP